MNHDQQLLHEYVEMQEHREYLLCEQNLYDYLVTAWKWFDPSAFKANWHLRAICEHVQACFEGEFQKLIVTVPPRCCKSSIISVAFPTWAWGPAGAPHTKFITASYGDRLAVRDATRSRRLIQTPWYQRRWANEVQLARDSNLKTRYDNQKGGFRMATSVGGAGTGEGYDVLIVDDPMKALDSESTAALRKVSEWWSGTMSTRKNDPATAREILIMQRLNEKDLAGECIAEEDWVHLNLPMEYEKSLFLSPLGWKDPREKEGELLWPERFPEKVVESLKKRLGSYKAAAQLQQRPAPAEGGFVKRDSLRYYATLPEDCEFFIISWDLTFDDTEGSDFAVGQVWAKRGADKYLVEMVRERMDVMRQVEAMQNLWRKYPYARAVLVENKANGPAVIKMLKHKVPRLLPVEPKDYGGSKIARLQAVVPEFEAGNVYLPMVEYNPWVEVFLSELQMFPKGAHDDTIDSATYALNWITDRGGAGIIEISDPTLRGNTRKQPGIVTQARQTFDVPSSGKDRIGFSDVRGWWN